MHHETSWWPIVHSKYPPLSLRKTTKFTYLASSVHHRPPFCFLLVLFGLINLPISPEHLWQVSLGKPHGDGTHEHPKNGQLIQHLAKEAESGVKICWSNTCVGKKVTKKVTRTAHGECRSAFFFCSDCK